MEANEPRTRASERAGKELAKEELLQLAWSTYVELEVRESNGVRKRGRKLAGWLGKKEA